MERFLWTSWALKQHIQRTGWLSSPGPCWCSLPHGPSRWSQCSWPHLLFSGAFIQVTSSLLLYREYQNNFKSTFFSNQPSIFFLCIRTKNLSNICLHCANPSLQSIILQPQTCNSVLMIIFDFFIKDDKVFSYYNYTLEQGYPVEIQQEFPGVPSHLDAAVECPKGECITDSVLFFKGYWITFTLHSHHQWQLKSLEIECLYTAIIHLSWVFLGIVCLEFVTLLV